MRPPPPAPLNGGEFTDGDLDAVHDPAAPVHADGEFVDAGLGLRSDALNKLTWIVIRKGGLVSDISVGDCIELTAALEEHHFRGSAVRPLFHALLKETGVLPASAPLRLRAHRIEGRRSVEQIVDAYGIECRPGGLLVEYFTERAPELDHVSLRSMPETCAGCSGATWRSTIRASTRCD
ncbi:hypothetical protein [Streptomyces sp. WMMC940]|uniref:hypothetical protein n=1 Tax=Streptomyces sp. WMMC940 TaxID=3015153 RepID=UPI0022B6B700|nr:hypothetical protein [Streptomyces sp. WMMC940]MCZ7460491.1 hypothetical protein [Streptomyces sp. WMMC940]